MKLKDLTPEQVVKVNRVINQVWQQIGYDVLEVGRISNKGAVECCLDANRPSTFCGQAGKEVEELLRSVEDDWTKKLTFFAKQNRLV